MSTQSIFYATGKRKSAVARTWIKPGKGNININGRSIDEYFKIKTNLVLSCQPLKLTNTNELFDVNIKVSGGGISGQAGAIRHGISKALIKYNSELRFALKKAGFVTRDSRTKERKKYGQRGARARFQFSKR